MSVPRRFAPRRRDKPERRIMQRAVAELRIAFTRRGYSKPFPFFHCPNEGELVGGEREAQQRWADGVESGVPDLVVLVQPIRSRYSYDLGRHVDEPCTLVGLANEIKTPGGRLSAAQRTMLEHFAAIGFLSRATYGHRETATLYAELGYISPEQRNAWVAWAERADPGAL